jgi:hypothetical protein
MIACFRSVLPTSVRLLLLGVTAVHAAEDTRGVGSTTSGARPTVVRGASGRILPDPVLLDGSSQPVEKKSEMGMIGDFELPGDENAKAGKVAGPQMQSPGQAGGQPSGNQSNQSPTSGGGTQSNSAEKSGGGGAQGNPSQGGQAGGGGGEQSANAGQQGGGAAGGAQSGGPQGAGPQGGAAGGAPIQGGGDPGAQAQGLQVAQLGGEASGQTGGVPGGGGQKPPQIAIGDKAMRIEPTAAGASVVGSPGQQVSEHTQQYEKGTGSGGKGPSAPSTGNRIEKGRVVPAGL